VGRADAQGNVGEIRILGPMSRWINRRRWTCFRHQQNGGGTGFSSTPKPATCNGSKSRAIHLHARRGMLHDGRNQRRALHDAGAGQLSAGDLVEVVGFPELSSASPLLREAVARKIGHALLPERGLST